MSHRLLAAVARNYRGPRHLRAVLSALADRANDEGIAWPSVATIAQDANLSERRVREHLAALNAAGIIRPVGSRTGGRAMTVRWQIVEAALRVENPATDRRVSGQGNPATARRKPCDGSPKTLRRLAAEAIKKQSGSKDKSTGTASPRLVDQPTEDATMTPHRNADRLPEWLPPAAWQEWRAHRGRKLTAPAIRRQLAKLDALRREGHDPAQVIALAVESGWASFYAPKRNPVSRKADQRAATGAAIFGDVNDGQPESTDPRTIDGEAVRVG